MVADLWRLQVGQPLTIAEMGEDVCIDVACVAHTQVHCNPPLRHDAALLAEVCKSVCRRDRFESSAATLHQRRGQWL